VAALCRLRRFYKIATVLLILQFTLVSDFAYFSMHFLCLLSSVWRHG